MPGGIGQMLGKWMGPAETGIGLALAYPTAGASLPYALQGATQMVQPGGALNPINPPSAPPPPPNAPQPTAYASAASPFTSSAGTGLGVGVSPSLPSAASTSPGLGQMPYDIASNIMANSPFGQYQQSAWG